MNIQEWMKAYEFKDIWNCMLTNWPYTRSQRELYNDIYCALKSVFIQSELAPSPLYLGLNAEGMIENRIVCRDIYNPARSIHDTDIWELASLTASRDLQDGTFNCESDIKFASTLLLYTGDMLMISVPYIVPILTNPYSSLTDKLNAQAKIANKRSRRMREGLAASAGTIKINWDLWYSVCSGLTFGSKREAMKIKEYFLHANNLMRLDVSYNHNQTKDVESTLNKIDNWLHNKTNVRLMMFIYHHPIIKYDEKMLSLWGENRFTFFEIKTVQDEKMQKDMIKLLLFADISKL